MRVAGLIVVGALVSSRGASLIELLTALGIVMVLTATALYCGMAAIEYVRTTLWFLL